MRPDPEVKQLGKREKCKQSDGYKKEIKKGKLF